MTDQIHSRRDASGVVGGLFVMAFFTALWASWSAAGFPQVVSIVVQVIFFACSALFLVGAGSLIVTMRRSALRETELRNRAPGEGWFVLIVAAEGILIGIASIALAATGNGDFAAPAIALIVGPHFIPMAAVFQRTIDYFIGAWVCAWAIAAIVMTFAATLPATLITSIVSTATACGTAAYGFYMLRELWRIRAV